MFPAAELARRGVLSVAGVGGKRGFRVYPPWATATSRQAAASQQWQCGYFLARVGVDGAGVDVCRARRLYDAVL